MVTNLTHIAISTLALLVGVWILGRVKLWLLGRLEHNAFPPEKMLSDLAADLHPLMFPLGSSIHPDMRATFEWHRIGIYSHVFGAAFALLLGPLQFSSRLRAARPAIHRLIGRL